MTKTHIHFHNPLVIYVQREITKHEHKYRYANYRWIMQDIRLLLFAVCLSYLSISFVILHVDCELQEVELNLSRFKKSIWWAISKDLPAIFDSWGLHKDIKFKDYVIDEWRKRTYFDKQEMISNIW